MLKVLQGFFRLTFQFKAVTSFGVRLSISWSFNRSSRAASR